MRDEYDDRLWIANRDQTVIGVSRLLDRIMLAFCVLHRVQWSAPWAGGHADGRH
jgi:hypothetical protein